VVFASAQGDELRAEDGRTFIDFFAGSGALNYGHNDPRMKAALLDHLTSDQITHALDLETPAKRRFLETLERVLLAPRGWDFKVQFCGPSGADANEAALKLARKVTGRRRVVAFSGAYHGMTTGALSVSGAKRLRAAGGPLLGEITFAPYETDSYEALDSIGYLRRMVTDPSNGTDLPAAVIVEPVQIQGGLYPASKRWLTELREWTEQAGILLICDEVQAGCGRTGTFFSFERAGIVPDIVTCAKSISGYGLPFSIVLLKREIDVWEPGEHTGTFRGNQLALVTAEVALSYWSDSEFVRRVQSNAEVLADGLRPIAEIPQVRACRAVGVIGGVDFGLGNAARSEAVQARALELGVLYERCGREGEVAKLMPPITIAPDRLWAGLEILRRAICEVVEREQAGEPR
jgi:diaminobutyrate-2-oxoglutarate transaminase